MAITINWVGRIINVPRLDMSLVQAIPTEIRQLDIDAFRMALKALEESETGMMFPDTHVHYPPTDVGGVTLARVVSLVNNYTITFEDGQYAVNLIGANSNIGDKVNVNQVSVRSSNSAGLVFAEGGAPIDAEAIAQAVWANDGALSVYSELAFVRGIEGGRWKISGSQMIFYAEDNITELVRFDLLFDSNGNPIERIPVI